MRFSLRTLLLALLAAGSVMALIANRAPWVRGWTVKAQQTGIRTLAFAGDGTFVTSSYNETAVLHDARYGTVLQQFKHDRFLLNASLSMDGQRLLTVAVDGAAYLWNRKTGLVQLVIRVPNSEIESADISPDGKHIVTSSQDNTVRIWNADTGQNDSTILKQATRVHFADNNRHVVANQGNRIVWLWDINHLQPSHTFQFPHYASTRGSYVNGETKILRIEGIALEGKHVSYYSGDSYIGFVRPEFDPISEAVYSRDTSLVLISGGQSLALCIAGSERVLQSWKNLSGHSTAIAFSPDANMFVCASDAKDGSYLTAYWRRRPEEWWGVAYLVEFWLMFLMCSVFAWSVRHDRRKRVRKTSVLLRQETP